MTNVQTSGSIRPGMGEASPVERPSSRRRETWMDVVRGVAVLLVVVLHAAYVPVDQAGLSLPGWTGELNAHLAPFRIPVLVILSGMLLGPSLDKGWRRFFAGKLAQIGWPYLVWTAVMIGLAGFLSVGLVLSYLRGGTYLWYLLFLLGYYAAAWLLRPVPAALVVALVAVAVAVLAPDGSKYGERLAYLFALFLIGHLVAGSPRAWRWLTTSPWVPGVGAVLLLVHLLTGVVGSGYGPGTLPGTLGGLLLAVPIASRLASWSLSRPLQFVGRQSLVYYVAHFPVMIIGTVVLVRLGVDNGLVVAGVVLLAAVVAATVLAMARRVRVVGWLFSAPVRRPEKPARV